MEKRPKIKLELSVTDRFGEWLGWSLLFGMFVYAFDSINSLPETIPVHFDIKGQPDGYGSSLTLLGLPIIALILTVGLTILNKYPEIFNYTVKINEENAERQYRAATRLIRWLKVAIILTFGLIMILINISAKNQNSESLLWVLPVILMISFVPIIIYLIVSSNDKKVKGNSIKKK